MNKQKSRNNINYINNNINIKFNEMGEFTQYYIYQLFIGEWWSTQQFMKH